jgi:methylase of polypeptide subunit release factors
MIKANPPSIIGIGLDISPTMLKIAQDNFALDKDKSIKVIAHDLNNPLLFLRSEVGTFDFIVTSLTSIL